MPQPIGNGEPRDSRARNQYSHLTAVLEPLGKRLECAPRISGDLKLSERAALSIGCADDEFKGLRSDAGAYQGP